MLREGKRLYDMGFSVIALRPKSKAPVENGWTKGPRKKWEEFIRTFNKAGNIGVRLGSATKFEDGTYLAVIDCDVKSKEKKDVREMEAKLGELLQRTPVVVMSGRGNSSRHVYIRTRSPVSPKRFGQAPKKVKVHMPSVQPTKFELENLSEGEIKKGFRLRPAWEISIMGTGQQVVLPPSVHPDTLKSYEWRQTLKSWKDIPIVDIEELKQDATEELEVKEDFKAEEVDLTFSDLDPKTISLIREGAGCEDRSAALFGVAVSMLNADFTENQILSVLTDPKNFLGQCAYDHTKSKSRKRAAEWVRKYSLKRAKKETSLEAEFDIIPEDYKGEAEITDLEAAKQMDRLNSGSDWRSKLDRNKNDDRLRNSTKNLLKIFQNAIGMDAFRLNEFTMTDVYGIKPPWNDSKVGDEVKDRCIVDMLHWFATKWRIETQKPKIYDSIKYIAGRNRFHPVREYLSKLKWDGVDRCDTWLKDYLGARGPEPYLSDVSRKILVAMIKRVMEPGCKFDEMLILEGGQGVGKSRSVRALAAPWFSDAKIDMGDKDAVVTMRSVWVLEMGELAAMRKTDLEQTKAFISRQTDRIRMPYGMIAEDFPRQCVFIGTTNSDQYLKDEENRRFWPVKVGHCRVDALAKVRDQLLAEAIDLYRFGETLYLENDQSRMVAKGEQKKRVFEDPWQTEIAEFLTNEKHVNFNPNYFDILELFSAWLGHTSGMAKPTEMMRAAAVLRNLGFKKRRLRVKGIRRVMWKNGDFGTP